jgi:hypothetical protein
MIIENEDDKSEIVPQTLRSGTDRSDIDFLQHVKDTNALEVPTRQVDPEF